MKGRVLLPLFGLLPGLSVAQVDLGQLWISPGFYSAHFDRSEGLKNENPGIGFEYPLGNAWSLTAGVFNNSERRTSHYLGAFWMPLEWKGMKFGAAIGGFNGYPNANDGGWFPAVIPTMAIEGQHWGLNIALIPDIKDRLHGAISFQLKFRFGGAAPAAAAPPAAAGADINGGSAERP
ncbi:hypothetical protein QTI66_22530 [Variovorax sp. J22R133]|uniref:hypothetical protein n=1 Tax=Variovorax brevis TaxID=3053503 RepID=UPI0025785F43|nr:hypothetical protein [Variovorax sp. J22R133]MDM0114943.1 hypothetical protein [Variovorax sp. J22R133]